MGQAAGICRRRDVKNEGGVTNTVATFFDAAGKIASRIKINGTINAGYAPRTQKT
jgi:hypothetical protein